MISCEKDGPYIGFSHCPVCSAKYATEMGKTIRALETALAAMTAERDARDVAIGVLAGECFEWRLAHVCSPVSLIDAPIIRARKRTMENPLARAAVEGER